VVSSDARHEEGEGEGKIHRVGRGRPTSGSSTYNGEREPPHDFSIYSTYLRLSTCRWS